MTVGVGATIGFCLSMLLVSGPMRRFSALKGKYTLSAFFSERYGRDASLILSGLILLLFPAYIIPQLLGAGHATQYVLGIDFNTAVIVVSIVFVMYTLIGGMLSVAWTDFIQGILMFIAMVGLALYAVYHFGGPARLVEQASAAKPGLSFLGLDPKIPWTTFAGFSLTIVVGVLSFPHVVMLFFAAKSVKKGRQALCLTATLCLLFHLVGYFGIAGGALILKPDLPRDQIDKAYLVVMDALCHPIARGVAVAGILSAIMSTTSALLLVVGAEFSNNVYKRLIRPDASDTQVIRAGQLLMLVVGVVTTLLALRQDKTIGEIAGILVGGVGSTFAVPLIAGLWWRRATQAGCIASMACGFISYGLAYFFFSWPKFSWTLLSLPLSILAMIIGSLVSSPPPERTRKLLAEMHTEE